MVFSLNATFFRKFEFQGFSSYWKLAIVKQEMLDGPVDNEKMTSHCNLKFGSFEKPWDVDRGKAIFVNIR